MKNKQDTYSFAYVKALLKFEAFYKLVLGMILIPFVTFVLGQMMRLVGYPYLTAENVFGFIKNPLAILLMIAIFLGFILLTLFDISTIIVLYDMARTNTKVVLKEAMKQSFEKCQMIVSSKSIIGALILAFLVPFLNLGAMMNVVATYKIPELLMRFLERNNGLCRNRIIFVLNPLLLFIYVDLYVALYDFRK